VRAQNLKRSMRCPGSIRQGEVLDVGRVRKRDLDLRMPQDRRNKVDATKEMARNIRGLAE